MARHRYSPFPVRVLHSLAGFLARCGQPVIAVALIGGLLAAALAPLGRPAHAQAPTGGTLVHDGLDRTYALYVPSSYDGTQAVPLVIALHPFASSGRAMEALTGLDAAAEQDGFIVVYPDSTDFFWDDGRSVRGWPADAVPVDDEGYLAALIDHLSETYTIDPAQITLAGFGNGGLMAYRMACAQPERFARVAVVGALMWSYQVEDCAAHDSPAPVTMLIALGSADPSYPAEGRTLTLAGDDQTRFNVLSAAETLAFWGERDGCDPTPDDAPDDATSVIHYSQCSADASLTFFSMPGVGANWPRTGDYTLNQFGFDLTPILARFAAGDGSWRDLAVEGAQAASQASIYGGVPRSYVVYVPPSYDPAQPVPLVVALHGRPDTGAGFAYRLDMNRVARENDFIVVYPDGIDQGWNAGRGVPGLQDKGLDDDEFLTLLAYDLALDLAIDSERHYLMGFSNGGFMTQHAACATPDDYAAFAVVSATFIPGFAALCDTSPPVPILFIHGTNDVSVTWDAQTQGDAVLTLSEPDTVAYWATHNLCDPEQVEHTLIPPQGKTPNTFVHRFTFGGCDPHGDMLFYAIEGGGHNLPGVPGRISPEVAGAVNTDIHAGEVIWEFFASHPAAP